jgi:hypothetical protein
VCADCVDVFKPTSVRKILTSLSASKTRRAFFNESHEERPVWLLFLAFSFSFSPAVEKDDAMSAGLALTVITCRFESAL